MTAPTPTPDAAAVAAREAAIEAWLDRDYVSPIDLADAFRYGWDRPDDDMYVFRRAAHSPCESRRPHRTPRLRTRTSRQRGGGWGVSGLYTIGHAASYDRGLSESAAQGERLYKLGRIEAIGRRDVPHGYPGGIVFRSIADAERRIAEEYSPEYAVYELEADEGDCAPSEYPGAYWLALQTSRPIGARVTTR